MTNKEHIVQGELQPHELAEMTPTMPEDLYQQLKNDIQSVGVLKPITIFQGKILDGRHRYRAARELGIDCYAVNLEVGVLPHEHVIRENLLHHHLTPAQRAMVAATCLDWHRKQAKERQAVYHGNQHDNKSGLPEPVPEVHSNGEATDKAGKMFAVSGRSVRSAEYVLNHGTPEEIESVKVGKVALKPIEQQVRDRVKESVKEVAMGEDDAIEVLDHTGKAHKILPTKHATFNRTNDSVSWAQWTWNPVTGCLHGCPYCYAKAMTEGPYQSGFPTGFTPTFRTDRLLAPEQTPIPKTDDPSSRRVFVCSMADLFGDWVPNEWIDAVFDKMRITPQWQYILLTKNPDRYAATKIPKGAWVGATVDKQDRVERTELAMSKVKGYVRWLSVEPMMGPITLKNPRMFDLIVIGGGTRTAKHPAIIPEFDWLARLYMQARDAGCSVWMKPNLGDAVSYPREVPA